MLSYKQTLIKEVGNYYLSNQKSRTFYSVSNTRNVHGTSNKAILRSSKNRNSSPTISDASYTYRGNGNQVAAVNKSAVWSVRAQTQVREQVRMHSFELCPRGLYRDRVTVARFDLNSSRVRSTTAHKFSLLTGRYAERRRRRRGRRRGRRYSSCNGVNYRRRTVPWHLQHHRSFHGQVHWFQLHWRSRRLQQKETCSSVAGNYH